MHRCRGQKVKGYGHMVTKTVSVASDACCYGRVLLQPAWVCMSIRLPMFSSLLPLHVCSICYIISMISIVCGVYLSCVACAVGSKWLSSKRTGAVDDCRADNTLPHHIATILIPLIKWLLPTSATSHSESHVHDIVVHVQWMGHFIFR